MKTTELIVIGSGGHARVVIDAANKSGFIIQGIIDTNYLGQNEKILGFPVIGNIKSLSKFSSKNTAIAIAIGDRNNRIKYYEKVKNIGFSTPPIIHPNVFISDSATINCGVFVNVGSIINADAKIGENTIINTSALIEHEVVIGKNCHIGPGVKLGGRVKVGDNTIIGIGSSVIDYINIGEDVTIGSGSVIIRNIDAHSTVVGIPGKTIK